MGCSCSKKTRCCHCRKKRALADEPTNQDMDDMVSNKEFSSWLNQTQPIKNQRWFYDLTCKVDLYCWLMISGTGLGIFVAHIIPIAHWIDPSGVESWSTCKLLFDPHTLSIPCIFVFHIVEGSIVIGILTICIYVLRKWSWERLKLCETLISICNTLTIALMVYEGIVAWIAFITDAEWYQSIPLLILLLVIMFGVVLGVYIRLTVFGYMRFAENYQIKYPKTESEIVSIVRETWIARGKVRVVGSNHSAPESIYVDDSLAANQEMISLDHYTGIEIIEVKDNDDSDDEDDDEKKEDKIIHRAIVKGGTCLGLNRNNPLSKKENGLVYVLQSKGYALQDLGGVVMQTVGGFTAMGCAGGSIYHDYYRSIYSIRIIDGKGDIHLYIKPTLKQDANYDDPFWGVIVSMGLMGIISEITFNLVPTYNVLGSQVLWPNESKNKTSWLTPEKCRAKHQDGDFTGTLDIFAENNDDKNSLYQLMTNSDNKHKTEYMRLFIWTQSKPYLVTVWKGHREQREKDRILKEWKDCYPKSGFFRSIPYHEVDKGVKGLLEQNILSILYRFFDLFEDKQTSEYPAKIVKAINYFIRKFNPSPGTQYFGSSWNVILPMDQEMRTKLLPMQFTELWFDIEDTSKAMKVLKEYWDDNEGLKHTGTFSWEMYPAGAGGYSEKPGGAWIRPSYGRMSFRIDALWFDQKTITPYDFYVPLWNLLIENDVYFRPHWAKYFPGGDVEFPKNSKLSNKYKTWSEYYAGQYPKWDKWMELRKELDPQNIFLSSYWAKTFGIKMEPAVMINPKNETATNATDQIELAEQKEEDPEQEKEQLVYTE